MATLEYFQSEPWFNLTHLQLLRIRWSPHSQGDDTEVREDGLRSMTLFSISMISEETKLIYIQLW